MILIVQKAAAQEEARAHHSACHSEVASTGTSREKFGVEGKISSWMIAGGGAGRSGLERTGWGGGQGEGRAWWGWAW